MIDLSLTQWNPVLQGGLAVLFSTFLPGWALARFLHLRSYGSIAAMAISPLFVYGAVAVSALVNVEPSTWGIPLSVVLCAAFVITLIHDRKFQTGERQANGGQIVFILIGGVLFVLGPGSVFLDRPGIFESDALVSWNQWAQIWAAGNIPAMSYGYPQLTSIVWSIPYWFMGPEGQFFSRAIYLAMLTLPLFAGVMVAKKQPYLACFGLFAYVAPFLFVAPGSWLSGTITIGFPDWTVCSFVVAGLLLALSSPDDTDGVSGKRSRFLAQVLFLAAASMKLVAGLFGVALFLVILVEVLSRKADKRELLTHTILLVGSGAVYGSLFMFVKNSTLPPIQTPPDLLAYFLRSYSELAKSMRFPDALLVLWAAGIAISFRSLTSGAFALAALIGVAIWIRTTAYDLRAVLPFFTAGLLLLGHAVEPLLPRLPSKIDKLTLQRPTSAAIVLAACFMTLFVAPGLRTQDELAAALRKEQVAHVGMGYEFNGWFLSMLSQGCETITSYGQLWHMETFAHHVAKAEFRRADDPAFVEAIQKKLRSSECLTVVLGAPGVEPYAPGVDTFLTSLVEGRGTELEAMSGWRRIVTRLP